MKIKKKTCIWENGYMGVMLFLLSMLVVAVNTYC